jgi:hypothetical protein
LATVILFAGETWMGKRAGWVARGFARSCAAYLYMGFRGIKVSVYLMVFTGMVSGAFRGDANLQDRLGLTKCGMLDQPAAPLSILRFIRRGSSAAVKLMGVG